MREIEKRGLSPVIATVLLISLALILATIIFLWARSFVKEKTQKFGEPIELACGDIEFVAEVDENGMVSINNIGSVPLYGVEIRKIGEGSAENIGKSFFGVGQSVGIPKGSGESSSLDSGTLSINDEVVVVPILLGESDNYKKPYTCDEEFGEIVTVV